LEQPQTFHNETLTIGANALQRPTSFNRSLAIQIRVIGALLMREILTRFGRHNVGFMWLFLEPMIFTLGIIALWTFAKIGHGHLPVVAFAVTGYSSVLVWRNMPGRCTAAISANIALMYHRNVRVIDVFLSRLVLEFAGATMSFLVLGSFFVFIGWMNPPEDLLQVIFGWFMLSWFGLALGLLVGALSERSEVVEKLWQPLTYLVFPLSGAAFMVDWLPESARQLVLYLPMLHGVEYLREGYFGSAVHAHYDLNYMSAVCLGMSFVALILVRQTGLRVVPE
jgi:ABC-type polysaccharide/polyol phosphate export permease